MGKKLKKPSVDLTVTTTQVNVICFGNSDGSATAIPAGGTPPYCYLWNTVPMQTTATASNLKAGPYTVTVTDKNGCSTSADVIITKSNIGKWFYPDKIIFETYSDINKPPIITELPVTVDNRYVLNLLDSYLNTDEQRKYEIIILQDPDFIEIEGKYFYVPKGRKERLTQTEIDIFLVEKILKENIQIIPKLLDYQLLKYTDKINRLYELEALFYNKTRFYISQREHKKDHQKICKKWVKRQLKRFEDLTDDQPEQDEKGNVQNPEDQEKKHLLSIPTKASQNQILDFWLKLTGNNEKGQPYWENEKEIEHFVNQNFEGFPGVDEEKKFTPNMNKSELYQVTWTFFHKYGESKGKRQYENLLLKNFIQFRNSKNVYSNIKYQNNEHLRKLYKEFPIK